MRRLHVASTEADHSSAGDLSGSVRSMVLLCTDNGQEHKEHSLKKPNKEHLPPHSSPIELAVRLQGKRQETR